MSEDEFRGIVKRYTIASMSTEFIRANGVDRGGMAASVLDSLDDMPALIEELRRMRETE